MNTIQLTALSLVTILAPLAMAARSDTLRIVINGGNLTTMVEILDPVIVSQFNVWTGIGTSSNEAQGMIVDWAKGIVRPPSRSVVYQIAIITDRPGANNTYRVDYAYDSATKHGFVFLPAQGDPRYEENAWLIRHGIEGNWFPAWSEFEKVAHPLIQSAARRP